jgi:hypothetical protein
MQNDEGRMQNDEGRIQSDEGGTTWLVMLLVLLCGDYGSGEDGGQLIGLFQQIGHAFWWHDGGVDEEFQPVATFFLPVPATRPPFC